MIPLKYVSNFWRTLEMSLINREINLILTSSKNCSLIADTFENQNLKFTNTKLYVPLITLSTQDNVKLLKQLELGFNN